MLLRNAARIVITGSLAGLAFLGLLFALGPACATWPTPVPAVDAGAPLDVPPVDRFADRTFNCHGQDLVLRATAMGGAWTCLAGGDTAACLLCLPYDDRSIACAVRDTGAEANASDLAGEAGQLKYFDYRRVADAARAWLTARRMVLR